MEIQDILTLIQAVDEHGLTELKLDNGAEKLSLKREEAPQIVTVAAQDVPAGVVTGAPAMEVTNASGIVSVREAAPAIDSGSVVSSPLVGTFYDASSPEAEPFVKVGDTVKKGQTLGIIEAMKLMNEIECEYDGVVEAVLVGNEDVVEYGQPLFRIR